MRSLSRAVNVRRRGRADNSEGADGGAATTAGLRPPSFAAPPSASSWVGSMGMSEAILPRPQGLNSRGVDVSLLLARRALSRLEACASVQVPQGGVTKDH